MTLNIPGPDNFLSPTLWHPDVCNCVIEYHNERQADGSIAEHCHKVGTNCPEHAHVMKNNTRDLQGNRDALHNVIRQECKLKTWAIMEAMKAATDPLKIAEVTDIDENTGDDVYTIRDGVELTWQFLPHPDPAVESRMIKVKYKPCMKVAVKWARGKGLKARTMAQRQKHLMDVHLNGEDIAAINAAAEKSFGKGHFQVDDSRG